jgi:hypothetical protein
MGARGYLDASQASPTPEAPGLLAFLPSSCFCLRNASDGTAEEFERQLLKHPKPGPGTGVPVCDGRDSSLVVESSTSACRRSRRSVLIGFCRLMPMESERTLGAPEDPLQLVRGQSHSSIPFICNVVRCRGSSRGSFWPMNGHSISAGAMSQKGRFMPFAWGGARGDRRARSWGTGRPEAVFSRLRDPTFDCPFHSSIGHRSTGRRVAQASRRAHFRIRSIRERKSSTIGERLVLL